MRLSAPLLCLFMLLLAAPAGAQSPPQTGFEKSDGAEWTTHQDEQAFLAAVSVGSPRVMVTELGKTKEERPVNLVEIGHPAPSGPVAARRRPTVLLTCSQHGNEPAGREACLRMLRDLAFTTDMKLINLMERATFLFVPSANPDGREHNTRENTEPQDINRDHLAITSNEAQAMAAVVRDYQPDLAIDLHEYGPSQPILYDDPVLWLWPRNLNTDKEVHDLAVKYGREYLVPAVEEAGYTADEYGQQEVADNDVAQTAGDADEGIMRNAMGLRHVLGILVETRVDADVRQSPTEPAMAAEVARRRVQSHYVVLQSALKFADERGTEAARVTSEAIRRKIAEGQGRSAPLYFDGADNAEPTPANTINPPPCGYRLTDAQVSELGARLELHGISIFNPDDAGPFVPLGQPAEPLIPLLLDARGARHAIEAKALDSCPPVPNEVPAGTKPIKAPNATAPACVKPRTVTMRLPRRKGKVLSAKVTAAGKSVKVRKGVAYIKLRKPGSKVKVKIVQRVRSSSGAVKTFKAGRTYRVCK
jgi:hypothetical protein